MCDVSCESARAVMAVGARAFLGRTTAECTNRMNYIPLLLLLSWQPCWGMPADSPVRVDLPVYDSPQSSDVRPDDPVAKESAPGEDRSDRTLVKSIITHKIQAATHAIGHKLASHNGPGVLGGGGGIFAPPVTSLEGVIFEGEDIVSKKISIKDNLHHLVAGFLQPKPLIDSIREEEKYGNHGEKFHAVGKALVGGAEGVSNLVNSVLEVPGNVFRKITRVATEKLNNLGGRLVGL